MANTVSTKKVTDLPENTDVKEEDLFIAGANGTASLRKIKFSTILKKIRNTLIANNRTTTEEGYALDARQGKEIQEQIDQLNTKITDGNKGIKVKDIYLGDNVYLYHNNGVFGVRVYIDGAHHFFHIQKDGLYFDGVKIT